MEPEELLIAVFFFISFIVYGAIRYGQQPF